MPMPDASASLKAVQRILRAAHGLEVEDLEYVIGRLRAIVEGKETAEAKQALIRHLGGAPSS